jgi:hypothetical protein
MLGDDLRILTKLDLIIIGNEVPKNYKIALAMVEGTLRNLSQSSGKPLVKADWMRECLKQNSI